MRLAYPEAAVMGTDRRRRRVTRRQPTITQLFDDGRAIEPHEIPVRERGKD